MNKTLVETDKFLASICKKSKTPSDYEFYIYILAKEFGITDLDKYPIPYLDSLIKTFVYVKEQEEKEIKKQQKKK
jgi:hypothetical protein